MKWNRADIFLGILLILTGIFILSIPFIREYQTWLYPTILVIFAIFYGMWLIMRKEKEKRK